jgi:hypothetical protein
MVLSCTQLMEMCSFISDMHICAHTNKCIYISITIFLRGQYVASIV